MQLRARLLLGLSLANFLLFILVLSLSLSLSLRSSACTSSIMDAATIGVKPQLRWWDLLRPFLALLAPCWASCYSPPFSTSKPKIFTMTGTIICSINSKVRLYIQEHPGSSPSIILDLPINTSELAGLMRYSTARIVLQCGLGFGRSNEPMLSAGTWAMLWNGQKMGYAMRRNVTGKDTLLLQKMRMISAGAGILPLKECDLGQCKYMRGQFERVVASSYSEAYHLMDPSGQLGQELSILFQGI